MPSVDRIVIDEDGASKTLTPDEWKGMPIIQRVRLLGGGAATFFAGATPVPAKLALEALR